MIDIRKYVKSYMAVAVFSLAWSITTYAKEPPAALTLDSAVALALENSPELRVASYQQRAAEAEARQAKLPSNPGIEGEIENFAGSGELSGTDAAEYTVMLTQPIRLGGKRSRQVRVATLEQQLAAWDYKRTQREVIERVKTAYIDLLADQEMAVLYEELLELSGEWVESAERRVKAGGASILEKNKAEIEQAMTRAAWKQGEARWSASQRKLAALLGVSLEALPPVTGDLYQYPVMAPFDALREALAQHPDWAGWPDEIEQREAEARAADADLMPDLELGVGWRRSEDANNGDGADSLVVAAGISLPLFNRNQGARQAAIHQVAAAREERRVAEWALEEELVAVYSDLAHAHAEATALEEDVLPSANKSFEVSREGYLQGRFGYLDLLDAQRTLFETRGQYIEACRMVHQALARVERLTASERD
jgi:cobalt-zinc-cadmium efflux system outer membrane protein